MSNTKWGTVYLDGIQLDIDPENYKIVDARRRGSLHLLLNGGTIVQDFGVDMTDCRISFSGVLVYDASVQALFALYRLTNHVFALTDFKGNNVMVQFMPGDNSFTATPIVGSNRAWTYDIKLTVVSATTWLGSAVPGTS